MRPDPNRILFRGVPEERHFGTYAGEDPRIARIAADCPYEVLVEDCPEVPGTLVVWGRYGDDWIANKGERYAVKMLLERCEDYDELQAQAEEGWPSMKQAVTRIKSRALDLKLQNALSEAELEAVWTVVRLMEGGDAD